MKKLYRTLVLATFFTLLTGTAFSEQGKGLNVIVTSADRQAQMMAMVLSVQVMEKHGKEINMVLCGTAGYLALKSTNTETFFPSKKSPTMLLNTLLKLGATIQVCPLYLPNAGKTTDDLIDGITVAKPSIIAGKLLDNDYQNLAF
jgi:predicted peroxiredoxin